MHVFNLTNSAGSIHRGYDAKSWDALLSGDLKSVLAAKGKFLDPATGNPFSDDEQAEIESAVAAAREAHMTQAQAHPHATITATARNPKAKKTLGDVSRRFWEA